MAAGSRTGRTIPTEGLVLCLDALDQNSYPFSGSRWLNLAQDKYHVTFKGPGPSHGGYVVTDGTGSGYFNTDTNIYGDFDDISANDRMLGPDEAHPGSFTINTWVNHRSFSSYKEYISWWQSGGNVYRFSDRGFVSSLEDYKKAQAEQAAKLRGGFEPAPQYTGGITSFAPASIYAAKGGLAEIKKFNEGGINYLPSKSTHDENDVHNYVRAQGYVEDGAGNGDKDEDTMLAQLADGEFVSRADAVLGAGILSGASPKDRKEMRSKGAIFFYDQQKKFKRIFDLVDAKREKTN